ncbi:hypothetical protein B0T16DRAFT_373376 [Cercophora newfieldiana]|uniref:Polyketide synthase n=1 Tax=Cercophora newfieldiana TaxID=92897 RepID=A0AA39Y3P2_9PEZI|nr:hypothetical protein B0T16DRAFT_373376 [Cercophora newfieldiana]
MGGPANEPIAIIGSGCRFPGNSTSPSKLWDLLREPRDVSSKIDRFAAESFYHSNGHHSGTSNVLHSYLLAEDTRAFDAQFFNIQGGEAGSIDPQQRLLMEVIYEALEAGGQRIEHLSGTSTGVYVGVMCNDFSQITYADIQNVPKYAATGTALSIMSNRISYFFNWTGPSMTIDTACSSSLIAVHQAVQLLRSGQSKLAVAAGSNLIFTPMNFIAESNVNMLSPTGRSRMWDAHADGYARGEGVACVVLKRLSDAIADGDTIECIVRETGINQDGRTPGITMPSSTSQASLIRQTYARAGLNPLLETDRCQYFEAHGTGTKAGDPQEARAIHEAFHAGKKDSPPSNENPLYVGSVKTVIGHTEGTAGIAGLIKASLSVQNGIIPANMLFTELNPDIAPYYGFLQIPTAAKPWPTLPPGVPRRASVNSFGFGGANAHAIVESYNPGNTVNSTGIRSSTSAIPLTLSANSEKALAAQVKTYLDFLEQKGDDINVRDLAWTLSHRSTLAHRVSIAAPLDVDTLKQELVSLLDAKKNDGKDIGVRPSLKTNKILGIFTGQGAQWPQMGYKLIQGSQLAADTIQALDASLQALPEGDRPEWSLQEELSKSSGDSRVMQAEFSQPLCTAVQVVLVDLLRAVGVDFDAVVGHSSGEIGAAYAAGYLTASDAIRVAYYRGRLTHLAPTNGAMLAAGTSLEDATDLCSLPVFRGRISVAASNSSASVTLSGDGKAIERAMLVLEDEGKFVRMLKVDKAYHSHHMQPVAEPYMEAMMSRIRVQVQEPRASCKWFSSVLGGELMTPDIAGSLAGAYWRDNLLQTVLFSQALEAALEDIKSPGLVVEVGPHPALKGPASGVIEEVCGAGVAYTGVLARGKDDVQALSAGIGAVWCNMVESPSFKLDFKQLDSLFAKGDADKPLFLKSVPTYTWDHDKIHFTESRATKALLSRPSGHHELLGVRQEGREKELRWRNFIKPTEMPWLRGHQVQGQMVFPGAGFASMAFEAGRALVDINEVSLVEVLDLRVSRAMALSEDDVGVESLVTLSNVTHHGRGQVISADFECTVFPNSNSPPFTASTARLRLELRGPDKTVDEVLPPRHPSGLDMSPVSMDHFYRSLATLGYNYSDMFRGIAALDRTTDMSSGVIHIDPIEDDYRPGFLLHPAPLDVAFQTVFGALGSPGDGRLWTTLVPTLMTRIKINPHACLSVGAGLGNDLHFDAAISVSASDGVAGDVDMFDSNGNALVQIEGLQLSPLTALTPQDDRQMFSQTEWGHAEPDATRGFSKWVIHDEEEKSNMYLIERACFFYMKRLHDAITPEERDACDWHRRKYLAWVADMVAEVSEGRHPIIQKAWMEDTWEMMEPMMNAFVEKLGDFHIIMDVGANLIPWVRNEVSFLEMYRESNLLEHVYKNTIGFPEYNAYLGGLVKQLSHRFRQMDILEVGAGTGSATEAILRRIGENYASFTYTDVSAGFFPEAQALFAEQAEKFVYSTLDVEKDPAQQGYSANSYDLVVASNVLHATKSLETTLRNVRKLLKPGGYLVILEITDLDPLRPTFFFGTLPGWWVGEADGRPHHPLITQQAWEGLLKKTGFSGLDTATPPSGEFIAPQSIMLSQAVDTQMELIRQPMVMASERKVALDDVLIIGGRSMTTFQLQEDVLSMLEPLARTITCVERFDQLQDSHFTDKQIVLSLTELDEPLFDPFSPAKWKALQGLTEKARNIVWITQGGLSGAQPYSNMVIGVARCLTAEKPGLRFQTIDFDDTKQMPDPNFVVVAVLRMHVSDAWAAEYSPTWTLEREVRVGADGNVTIPRYIASEELDARYNSSHRTVREDVSLRGAKVEVDTSGQVCYELRSTESEDKDVSAPPEGHVEIQVERSSLMAPSLKSVGGALHLVCGTATSSGEKVLAFSTSDASVVSVPASWTIPCTEGWDPTTLILEAVVACWAHEIMEGAIPGTTILVHEPPTRAFALALQEAAVARDVSVRFTTCKRDLANQDPATFAFVHPASRNGRAIITRLFKKEDVKRISTFVDMSGQEVDDAGGLAARIQSQLPVTCQILDAGALMSKESYARQPIAHALVSSMLEKIALHLGKRTSSGADSSSLLETVPIAALPGRDLPSSSPQQASSNSIAVLDWTVDDTVATRVWPSEDLVRFRQDKTYWLVGLAGQLGQSLCWWMIQRGARNIVITSRNPRVSEAWMDRVVAEGARVSVLSCDVTDRRSVMKTYQTIVKTMPPIAGVCNGAMILNDGIIAQMSHEKFDQTLRPKVDGTRFLDEIFDKPNLDFFIVFSSLAYVTGNIGQSSYAAANAFMASVAQGRRARGLAGSVMNLAGIFGIGYITRTDAGILERLAKMGYSNVSEWDFLQFFAEAVMAGKPDPQNPDSHQNISYHEISSSLRPYDPELDENPPSWLPIPRFSYYRRTKVQTGGGDDDAQKTTSVRAQLKQQTTSEGVHKVLTSGLAATLYKQLGLAPEDNTIQPHTRLVDLGIDSLVAVDMRFWFTKELDLDMPVLKLLGGASVEEMVADIMERLSPELTPNLNKGAATPTTPVEISSDESSRISSSEGPSSVKGDDAHDSSPSSSVTPPESEAGFEGGVGIKMPMSSETRGLVFQSKQSMGYPSLQFWFMLQHLNAPCAFNCSFRIAFRGRLDIERMKQAAEALGRRHDSLRTAFFDDPTRGHEPTQAVLAPSASPLRLEVLRVSGLQDAVDFTDHVQYRHVFDLNRGEVIRMALLSVDEESHYLVIGLHHIAMDGYSFDVFLRELVALYEGRQLDPVQTQWNDLVAEQRLAITTGSMKKEVDFWKKTLLGGGPLPEPLLMLPFAKVPTRMPVTHFEYEEVPMVILDEITVRAIRERCRALQVTRFHFFMTVLRTMLFAITSDDVNELCIGMIDANRTDTRATNLIGLMVNMLPMKFSRKATQSFAQACHEVRDMAYAALAHSRLPFKAMLDQLAVPRSNYCSPLFQVALDYLPHKFETPTGLGTPTDEVQSYLSYGMTDLVLDINDISASEIRFRWRAQTDLYSKDAVQTMMDMYVKLVKRFAGSAADCKAPMEKIRGGLQLYDQARIQEGVKMSLGPAMASKWPSTASHVIDSMCAQQPNAIALKDEKTVLSYGQLAKRVEQIEHALLNSGSGQHERVACYQLPTVDWVCSLLAVWRIGAAYVPLDSRLPEARIASLLELSMPSAVLCRPETFEIAKAIISSEDVAILDVCDLPAPNDKVRGTGTKAALESPAVILFTSGSTGTPKGVELRHENLTNVIEGTISRHSMDSPLVALQQSAASFDMSLGQTLLGLCTGGTVVVVPRDKRGDPQEICKIIRDERVSFVLATPSEVTQWLWFGGSELRAAAEHLRYAFIGGEAFPPLLRTSFRDVFGGKGIKVVNVYGPTETILWCTTAEINCEDNEDVTVIPLGKPMPNYGVFVVDKDMKPVPQGVTGEVVITGASVANGYFGQEALTKAAFLPDTLTPPGSFPTITNSAQMYCTGDNARFGPDGQLYYQGRIAGDSQVKLNGIRIEIQEVESAILESAQGALSAVVVSARRNPDFLVGHVEFAPGHHHRYGDDAETQGRFLASLVTRLPLPRYMCPAMLIPLERIPMNEHGKIDRRAIQKLPLPAQTSQSAGIADLSETEKALWDIWAQVLPEECTVVAVEPDTDFFSLGGGSYLLVLVQRLIRERFRATVPVMQLFDSSTLRGMAAKVDAAISVALIEWDVETALEEEVERLETGHHTKPKRGEGGVTVVLTGATGYLGRNLLKTLRISPAVQRIYCVGVRSADRLFEEDKDDKKVTLLSGDIGAPLLGLSPETFDQLAREADIIVHSGANRSFWDYYQTLRPSNFVSTKTLVKMASVGRTPLHFISSGGLVTHNTDAPGSVTAEGTPPTDGSNGYLATKWASEAYLENAARRLGIPVRIHRVVGASVPATTQTTATLEEEQLTADFRDLVLSLNAIPQPEGWRGSFDVVRTSSLCRALVEEHFLSTSSVTITEENQECEGPRYIHHSSDLKMRIEDVISALGPAGEEGEFESLPPHVWVGRAKAAGIDWHFSGQDFGAAGAEGFVLKR